MDNLPALLQLLTDARPYWSPANAAADLVDRAFGSNPSLTAQGDLLKSLHGDKTELDAIATAWSTRVGSLRPGVPPKYSEDGKPITEKKAAPRDSNPWKAAEGQTKWTPEQSRAQIAMARSDLGRAQSLALSAGSFLGAPRPGAKSMISRFERTA